MGLTLRVKFWRWGPLLDLGGAKSLATAVNSTLKVPVAAVGRAVRTIVVAPACPLGICATTPEGRPERLNSKLGRSLTAMCTVSDAILPCVRVTMEGLTLITKSGSVWADKRAASPINNRDSTAARMAGCRIKFLHVI